MLCALAPLLEPGGLHASMCLAGEQQSEKPVRINGVLKKVWRSMGSKSLTWQEITKPTVETPAAAVAAT